MEKKIEKKNYKNKNITKYNKSIQLNNSTLNNTLKIKVLHLKNLHEKLNKQVLKLISSEKKENLNYTKNNTISNISVVNKEIHELIKKNIKNKTKIDLENKVKDFISIKISENKLNFTENKKISNKNNLKKIVKEFKQENNIEQSIKILNNSNLLNYFYEKIDTISYKIVSIFKKVLKNIIENPNDYSGTDKIDLNFQNITNEIQNSFVSELKNYNNTDINLKKNQSNKTKEGKSLEKIKTKINEIKNEKNLIENIKLIKNITNSLVTKKNEKNNLLLENLNGKNKNNSLQNNTSIVVKPKHELRNKTLKNGKKNNRENLGSLQTNFIEKKKKPIILSEVSKQNIELNKTKINEINKIINKSKIYLKLNYIRLNKTKKTIGLNNSIKKNSQKINATKSTNISQLIITNVSDINKTNEKKLSLQNKTSDVKKLTHLEKTIFKHNNNSTNNIKNNNNTKNFFYKFTQMNIKSKLFLDIKNKILSKIPNLKNLMKNSTILNSLHKKNFTILENSTNYKDNLNLSKISKLKNINMTLVKQILFKNLNNNKLNKTNIEKLENKILNSTTVSLLKKKNDTLENKILFSGNKHEVKFLRNEENKKKDLKIENKLAIIKINPNTNEKDVDDKSVISELLKNFGKRLKRN